MNVNQKIIEILKKENISFVVSLPCKFLDKLIRILYEDSFFTHIPVTREEEGIGICSGAFLAGKFPAIVMQNSGLGNSVNALASLSLYYGIPIILLISHRGTEGENIDAQIPMSKATPKILNALGIEYVRIEKPEEVGKIREIIQKARKMEKPVAILLPISFWRENEA